MFEVLNPIIDLVFRMFGLLLLVLASLVPVFLLSHWLEKWTEETRITIRIRKTFRLADALCSVAAIFFTFAIIFLILSNSPMVPVNVFRYAIDNWYWDYANKVGLLMPSGEDWLHLKYFLSAFAAATFAVPAALMVGMLSLKTTFTLSFTENYIRFPIQFASKLKFRTKRRWRDLTSFQVSGESDSAQMVRFHFRDGSIVCIPRSDFSECGLNQILHRVAIYAFPSVVGHQGQIEGDATLSIPASTYTQLWEDDFQRHFRSTTFVPLQNGVSLQNKRLTIINQLATTAMSATYLAQLRDGSKVILKESVSAHDSEAGRKAKELFLKECEHLSTLDHRSIAKVVDSFVENNRCYLALQYIPGQDLYQRVKKFGVIAEIEVLNWAHQICETLSYLHSQNPPVIHRDLTPHNLVLDNARKVFVIDFGAANRFQSNVTGTMIGKQCYMAPEQLRGKATPQSDLYALGATIHFLLTGSEPEPLSVCSPQSLNRNVSDEVNRLVEDLTRFDTTERTANAVEVEERLNRLIIERSTSHTINLRRAHDESLKVDIRKKEPTTVDAT